MIETHNSFADSLHEKTAFTLVELLVVIAIVGILAALLLAAIPQTKARALQVQCANNVRQLGIGLQEFLTDNNNRYPLATDLDDIERRYWMMALQNTEISLPNSAEKIEFSVWTGTGVWKCPAANQPTSWTTHSGYLSYGYNWLGLRKKPDTNGIGIVGHQVCWITLRHSLTPAVSESEVVSPSDMMAIGDGMVGNSKNMGDGAWVLWRTASVTNYFYPGSAQRTYARHQGKANVVFCDGHVESPTLKYLFEDNSDEALSRWNRDHQPHRELLEP